MYLSDDKLGLMQELISKLYTHPFNEALVLEVAPSVCQLTDAQYFTFVISSPNKRSDPLLITNDPPELIPVYYSVYRIAQHCTSWRGICDKVDTLIGRRGKQGSSLC